MATKLTTPESRPDITHHAITRFTVEVPHKLTVAPDDLVIDKDRVLVRYRVVQYNSDGTAIDIRDEEVTFAQWPGGVKTDMASIYNALTTDAKNKGLIDPGTDEPL